MIKSKLQYILKDSAFGFYNPHGGIFLRIDVFLFLWVALVHIIPHNKDNLKVYPTIMLGKVKKFIFSRIHIQ